MFHDLVQRLTLPGLPEWSGLALLLLLLLGGLCLLLMPFSVFGVKGRLEAIEAQLDEMRAEIRALGVRLRDAGAARDFAPRVPEHAAIERGATEILADPLGAPSDPPPLPEHQPAPPPARGRAEPRITWPRPR